MGRADCCPPWPARLEVWLHMTNIRVYRWYSQEIWEWLRRLLESMLKAICDADAEPNIPYLKFIESNRDWSSPAVVFRAVSQIS